MSLELLIWPLLTFHIFYRFGLAYFSSIKQKSQNKDGTIFDIYLDSSSTLKWHNEERKKKEKQNKKPDPDDTNFVCDVCSHGIPIIAICDKHNKIIERDFVQDNAVFNERFYINTSAGKTIFHPSNQYFAKVISMCCVYSMNINVCRFKQLDLI